MAGPEWIEQAVSDALLSSAGVTALAGQRVYPLKIPQGTMLPCVVYQRTYSNPDMTLIGYSSERVTMMVNAYGKTYGEVKDLAKAIRGALAASPLNAQFQGDQDLYMDESTAFGVTMEFICQQFGGYCNG